jgi:hypothetical protein
VLFVGIPISIDDVIYSWRGSRLEFGPRHCQLVKPTAIIIFIYLFTSCTRPHVAVALSALRVRRPTFALLRGIMFDCPANKCTPMHTDTTALYSRYID